MKRKFLIALFSSTITFCSVGQKTICVTVDDLPVVSYSRTDIEFQQEITRQLISTFDRFSIPAIGYVNEGKCYTGGKVDSLKVGLLRNWLSHGYELGNHTYAHVNFHEVPFSVFAEDIRKGEIISKSLSSKYGKQVQFFRHPYLRSGRTKSQSDSLRVLLVNLGYREAPVTIDNEDYVFALAYHKAFVGGDSSMMKKIGVAYINYMEEKLIYFERLSVNLYERQIAQTLLLHANLLNAHYLDDLAEMYVRHGYTFVSQSEVLKDPVYSEPITRYGDWGNSWLERWAMSKGKTGDFFKDEPRTPGFVVEMSNQ